MVRKFAFIKFFENSSKNDMIHEISFSKSFSTIFLRSDFISIDGFCQAF